MTIPTSRKATDIPGDTARVMTSAAKDFSGQVWPKGTVYQPLCGGYDNANSCDYSEVSIGGARVIFLASASDAA